MSDERPSDEEIHRWHRWFAAAGNNRGWVLAEQRSLDDAERRELLYTAYAAAHHWDAVGTEVHAARAELLLARAHARCGHGELAMHYAGRAFGAITGETTAGRYDAEPWEVAFAHAAIAEAAACLGDAALHRRYHASAKALGDALADDDDRAIFYATFNCIPAPVAAAS